MKITIHTCKSVGKKRLSLYSLPSSTSLYCPLKYPGECLPKKPAPLKSQFPCKGKMNKIQRQLMQKTQDCKGSAFVFNLKTKGQLFYFFQVLYLSCKSRRLCSAVWRLSKSFIIFVICSLEVLFCVYANQQPPKPITIETVNIKSFIQL